ncbi:MAG: class I SAM-dependent methyltransferase [Alphaproteobacteria bacterium]|nr:class I SAM-dependent methyltransferase [Alphaproteobacteria bacterium]
MTDLQAAPPVAKSDGMTFPSAKEGGSAAVWQDGAFQTANGETRILVYNMAESGWSDEHSEVKESMGGADHPIDLASRRWTLGQLQSHVAQETDSTILEIGFNDGRLLAEIGRLFPKARLIGADYVISLAQQRLHTLQNIPLLQFDLRQAPLADGFADAIVLLNVLEHIDDDALAMRQVARMLKPGGVAVIEVPAGSNLYDFYDAYWLHHRRYDAAMLRSLAQAAGLQVIEQTFLGSLVYPAFWLTKKISRLRFGAASDKAPEIVAKMNANTRSSHLMAWVMAFEARMRRMIFLPFGIRYVLTCRKI